MLKKYKLPIHGTVIKRDPLQGKNDDPILVIPFEELPNRPTEIIQTSEGIDKEVRMGFRYMCLDYNIDEEWCEVELEASEEFHSWLTNLLPQLNDFKVRKGWKLDKSRMVELGK